jgi:hypothetical protein
VCHLIGVYACGDFDGHERGDGCQAMVSQRRGYLQARRDGRYTYYKVTDPRVAELILLAHTLAADNHAALYTCHRIPQR